nr:MULTISPECIES: tRNA (adenosine(37)-N6)-dimethylallyltransferase MiaA [unclassified Enterococcus]
MNNKVLVIVGPTAVGKTSLGIDMACKLNGEIISGDSMQVYRHLDIGTAKATPAEQLQAKHHLIDIKSPDEAFSAFDFVTLANKKIAEIIEIGKLPIIVGGTGLYIQSLIEGYHLGGSGNQQEMKQYQHNLEISTMSNETLWQKLSLIAPAKAEAIPVENRRRLVRKLTLAKFQTNSSNQAFAYDFKVIGLNTNRELLYQRINQRVDLMLTAGLVEEAQWLKNKYPKSQACQAIGYKEFFPYFEGQANLDDSIELIKRNSRRYAKRQLTWFRNRMNVQFWDLVQAPELQKKLESEVMKWL